MTEFDPTTAPDEEFPLVPEGIYRVMVNATALKANRNTEGSHVAVEFGIIEGATKGQRLWHNFNIENPKERARNIGRAQMKKFLAAIGVTTKIDLASQLPALAKGKTLWVDVVHEPDYRDPTKSKEAIKRFDASREPSTVSKAQGAAYAAPGGPDVPDIDQVGF